MLKGGFVWANTLALDHWPQPGEAGTLNHNAAEHPFEVAAVRGMNGLPYVGVVTVQYPAGVPGFKRPGETGTHRFAVPVP